MSIRREPLCCPDVAHVAAQRLPVRKACRVEGPLLDDPPIICGLGQVLHADLHATPRFDLFATDATPEVSQPKSPVSLGETFTAKRLEWGPTAPPWELTPTRCAAAGLVTLHPCVNFQNRCKKQDHWNYRLCGRS